MGQPGGYQYRSGSGWEVLAQDLDELRWEGIRAVVSLTEEALDRGMLKAREMSYLHLPVGDMRPPTLEDALRCMEFVREAERGGRPVLIHCRAGQGRTGTMLACYLVEQGMEAEQALAQVRRERPGSVETAGQEETVREYAAYRRSPAGQSA